MGQKVNPKILRVGQTLTWNSKWFSRGSEYLNNLQKDTNIRSYLKNKLRDAGVDKVEIDRSRESVNIVIYTSKPGIIIGRGGTGVEEIKNHIQKKIVKSKDKRIVVDVKEVNNPSLSSQVVALNIAQELERRVPYRRAMKRNIEACLKAGAKGVKVVCSGRLDGVEIARKEILSEGRVPLHTIRANIDYGRAAAVTIYGTVGVKVWIYKGEIFEIKEEK